MFTCLIAFDLQKVNINFSVLYCVMSICICAHIVLTHITLHLCMNEHYSYMGSLFIRLQLQLLTASTEINFI